MIEEGSSFSGSSLSGQAPVAGRSQILLHRRPPLPLKRAFAHLDDKAQHTDMSWSASSCRLHRMDSNPYLTPARVSDHLFNPQGNKTTIAPKRIIAYIWDIISIDYHLRFNFVFFLTGGFMGNKSGGQNVIKISKIPIKCKMD